MNTRPWHDSYDPGIPRELALESITLPGILARTASTCPEATAIRFVNSKISYAHFAELVSAFAGSLERLGLERGDRVAIHLPNLPQCLIAFYGTLAAGGVAVMTNPLYVPREIEHQWRDAGCKIAVTTDFLFTGSVAEARSKVPVQHYIVASIPDMLAFPLNLLAPFRLRHQSPPAIATVPAEENVHRFPELLRVHREHTVSLWERVGSGRITESDVAVLQYTGGTTGVAKGAMLTHRNLAANAAQNAAWFPLARPGEEVFLSALPFFHVFGLTVAMNYPIFIGGEMVVVPNPRDIRGLVRAVEHQHVTIFPIVPSMVRAICNLPKIDHANLSSLRVCVSGSAPLPEAVLRRFEELTGAKLIEGFGLTEASPVTHCNPVHGDRVVNSIGLPLPNTDCRIVSEDGRDVPTGEAGELLLRGPQIMRAYWNQPNETAVVLRDGWLHTGDLATMDERGYFRIVGRKKEMIVAGGYKIYPDEVDRVLALHPEVLESATIGVPDDKRGETVKSFVVLQSGHEVQPSELMSFCGKHLAPYKVPKQIELRRELPKSSVMKILRRQLLEEELAKKGR
jgi:long-chain acyl-CoA synthetase